MAKKKYSKKYETWGGRELKAIINGKLAGVKYDKGSGSYFWREPQTTGRAQKRNLSRNKGKAVILLHQQNLIAMVKCLMLNR